MIFDTASRCEITDIEGNNYTDFSSGYGVINIGWQRKELIKVIQTQAEKSCFSIPWMGNPEATRLAEKLIMLTPEKLQKGNPFIKMMIIEPVIGSGGIIVPPGEYWKILREICNRYDIKLIVDEVLTGFGRTGSLFAIDQIEIVPDVLTLSKGMCSGYVPIGAALMTSELSDYLCRNFNDVTSTYARTPLACAVALENINLIIQEKLDLNAQIMGTYFINRLREIFNRCLPDETGEKSSVF